MTPPVQLTLPEALKLSVEAAVAGVCGDPNCTSHKRQAEAVLAAIQAYAKANPSVLKTALGL